MVYKQFGVKNLEMSVADFMSFIADIFSGGVQGGKRTAMCDTLTSIDYEKK